MPTFQMFVVDAFSNGPFTGNQAAVCLVERKELSYELHMKIASEMKHSETAFIQLINENDSYDMSSEFKLRWFTPTTEVSLCGHATLASAAILFNCIGNQSDCILFQTSSGQLSASKKSRDGDIISLNFPLNAPFEVHLKENIKTLLESTIGCLKVLDVQFCETTKKLLIRLEDSEAPCNFLGSIKPDFETLLKCSTAVKGVIVTTKKSLNNEEEEEEDVDFYSRYFAPWVGINEDPVTGSAHTVLLPYWSKIIGKNNLKAMQCSDRSGILWLRIIDGRCEITGKSFVVLQGFFTF